MTPDDSLIVKVLKSADPDWESPKDRGTEWVSCLCPFHGDNNPSASVSYRNNAFNCFACGEKGDAIGLIMKMEGMTYREAVEHAETVSPGSREAVQGKPAGKPGRRVFGESGSNGSGSNTVRPGIRGRSSPWT